MQLLGDLRLVLQLPQHKTVLRQILDEAQIHTGGLGLITDPQYADEIITSGQADLVFIGRELLREPYWGLKAQPALGIEPEWPVQYGYMIMLLSGGKIDIQGL